MEKEKKTVPVEPGIGVEFLQTEQNMLDKEEGINYQENNWFYSDY